VVFRSAAPDDLSAVQGRELTILYLARHGESDWNAENRFQGHVDRPLTSRGRAQAAALAQRLSEIPLDAVYSSPLRRALETAAAVATEKGLRLVALPDLREVDVGTWAGLSRPEVAARFPQAFQRWLDGGEGWEGGETYRQMSERVLGVVLEIAARHRDGSVLIVSHGGPIRAVVAAAAQMDVHAYRRLHRVEVNAGFSRVAVEGGRITPID
jgi:broad specificity phosphatase PhoE